MPKKSKIWLLPEEIKRELDLMLQDGRLTQKEILNILNEQNPPEPISRSGLNRYAKRMDKAGEKIRQAREVSQQWIEKLGEQGQEEVSKVAIEMVRAMVFDWVLKNESNDLDPKTMQEVTLSLLRLERASSETTKREEQILKAERERILTEAKKEAKHKEITPEAFEVFRKSILGLS